MKYRGPDQAPVAQEGAESSAADALIGLGAGLLFGYLGVAVLRALGKDK